MNSINQSMDVKPTSTAVAVIGSSVTSNLLVSICQHSGQFPAVLCPVELGSQHAAAVLCSDLRMFLSIVLQHARTQ